MSPRWRVSCLSILALCMIGLVIAASAAARSPAPAADNLLQNPGFESTLSPWWSACAGEAAIASSPKYGGESSARLYKSSVGPGEAAVCQIVPVTPLASYSASGHFYLAAAGVGNPQMQIVWQTASGQVIATASLADCPPGAWCSYSTAGQAPANASAAIVRARAYVRDPYISAYVDDTNFIQTAPPMTHTPTATLSATRSATPARTVTRTPTATRPPAPTASRTPTASPTETATTTPTTTPSGAILISEVEYDRNHRDVEANYEWFELHNPSVVPVTLSGWTVRDNTAADASPDMTVGPGSFVVIAAWRARFMENYPSFSGALVELGQAIGNGLANSGDRLVLSDGSGRIVDSLSYGDDTTCFDPAIAAVTAKGHSLERQPSGQNTHSANDWHDQARPSPGEGWHTPTPTPTIEATASPSATATNTVTPSLTPSPADTASPTHTASATASATPSRTATATAQTADDTPTATMTTQPTATATATATATPTPPATPTPTPTMPATPTLMSTPPATLAPTDSATPRPTDTATAHLPQTATPSATPCPTQQRRSVFLPVIVCNPLPTATPSATPDAHVVSINEVLPAPHTIDWNGDGKVDSGDEWVELYNGAAGPVDVSGWVLDDEENAGSPLYFLSAGTVIAGRGYLVLFGKQTSLNFANTKDVVRLLYKNGDLIEQFRYYDTWDDRSFSKTQDGGAQWTYWYQPSPGATNRP